MNDQEKYLFDNRGYLVVKNALTDAQVAALTSRLLENPDVVEEGFGGSDRSVYYSDEQMAWTSRSLLDYGGPFVELIDLPSVAPYLEFLLQPHYRLDHDYLKIDRPSDPKKLFLHGGGQGAGRGRDQVGPHDGGQCYYRYNNEKMYNGLVAVAFELKTVNPGDGGFACVPGSHKANYGLPEEWRIKETQADVHECVDRVTAEAGDAIVFTEACAHGTLPWEGEGERWTLFYKYCPHAIAWSPCYYNADNYEGLTEQQRLMLMPPSAYGPHEHTRPIWERAQQEQRELKKLRSGKN